MEELAALIAKVRKQHSWSYDRLAKELFVRGMKCTSASLHNWESQTHKAHDVIAEKLTTALEEFLDGKD